MELTEVANQYARSRECERKNKERRNAYHRELYAKRKDKCPKFYSSWEEGTCMECCEIYNHNECPMINKHK